MQSALPFIAALVFGYLLGSIPFGLILTRIAGVGWTMAGLRHALRTGDAQYYFHPYEMGPRPALALRRVSPTAPRDCLATNAAETRGTVAVPKLSFCSTRTLAAVESLGHNPWCCSVQPTLSRRATTSV